MRSRIFPGLAAVLLLTGCGTDGFFRPRVPKAAAASPAADAAQAVRAAAKVKDGGILPSSVSRVLDADAQKASLDAEFQALEFGNPGAAVAWTSGKTRGAVTAATPYQVGKQNCRAYTHTIFLTAAPETARGTACRNADGTWSPLR